MKTSEDSQPMTYYKLVSHCKPLGPIISKLSALLILAFDLEGGPKVKSDYIKRFLAHDFI